MTGSSSWDQFKFLVRRNNNQPTTSMTENVPTICKFPVILFAVSVLFCFVSFVLCIVAEILRNKEDEIRWNGRLCHAPAFG
ncbi:uncharacterized protein LOC114751411 isoform X2 [Neltuma alba]|uniref:uncharacterized protein LOC114751411 isoform X2 n=1 Tax=Neltuma alba TaxID=207710 RepID=UPI0010A2AE7F|nr:uncharacterized protein LOC114751411 isoform X2 [Prosopis alba]